MNKNAKKLTMLLAMGKKPATKKNKAVKKGTKKSGSMMMGDDAMMMKLKMKSNSMKKKGC